MATDPVSLPDATTGIGAAIADFLRIGLRRRHWWHVEAVTDTYVVDDDSEHLSCSSDASGSGYDITLPLAADAPGQTLIVSVTSTFTSGHTITLRPPSGETVDGSATLTLVAIAAYVIIQCDGTSNWILLHDGR
jgi:hypothetical protein